MTDDYRVFAYFTRDLSQHGRAGARDTDLKMIMATYIHWLALFRKQ